MKQKQVVSRLPSYPSDTSFDTLPDGWRVATIDDFHVMGNKHVGMKYILRGFYSGIYEQYTLTSKTSASDLMPWIKEGRCYVKTKLTK